MVLVYREVGKDDFTFEELPSSCDTLGKAKARACMMFTKALHTKRIDIDDDGFYAYLQDDGNVLCALRRKDTGWAWIDWKGGVMI